MLGEFLTEHGYVVHAARDGRHALQVLSHMDPPDLILLDYQMPVMDGNHFLARKRLNPRLRCVPVVILSAWTREWSGAGIDAVEVLSKPVDLNRLLTLAQHICDGTHSIHMHSRGSVRGWGDQRATARAL